MPHSTFKHRAISDAPSIRVLASPIRQELVDTLAAMGGEASASALAAQLGRHADGLYYHLRLLCAAKLVCQLEQEPGAERRYRLTREDRTPLRLAYDTGHENRPALRKFVHGLLQIAQQDFEHALDMPDTVVEGAQRQLWAARNKAWLSADELEEVNTLLERLCELMSKPRTRGRDQLMSCAFILAPVMPRPIRRQLDE